MTINLLFKNFSKQVSIAVASKIFTKTHRTDVLFQTLRNFQLVELISHKLLCQLCEWCHNPCFGSSSWCNSHHKNII